MIDINDISTVMPIAVTPLGQGFMIVPASRIGILGHVVTFQCQHSTADDIGWTMNGNSLGSNGNKTVQFGSDDRAVHWLTINLTAANNNTEIVCIAKFLDGSTQETTPAIVLVQGITLLVHILCIIL